MLLSKLKFAGVLAAACCLLSGCGTSGNSWQAAYEAGKADAAAQPAKLGAAEKSFKSALAAAAKDHLPDPQLEPVFTALGQVLVEEGKFNEAQDYLLHAVSLATATRMPVEKNLELLGQLERCYEQTRNFPQALQTQTVLVTYLSTENSPFDPRFKAAVALRDRLKTLAAAEEAAKADSCCEGEDKAKARESVADKPLSPVGAD